MPIQYKAVKRTNPTKPADPKKFYATVTGRQPVDLKTIAQSISDTSTTVSHVDVYAVLMALTDEIRHRLLNGENIHLGDLGYFHITLQSKGVDKAEDVNAATIETAKVRFVSGKDLDAGLASAEFKKAPESKKDKPTPPQP